MAHLIKVVLVIALLAGICCFVPTAEAKSRPRPGTPRPGPGPGSSRTKPSKSSGPPKPPGPRPPKPPPGPPEPPCPPKPPPTPPPCPTEAPASTTEEPSIFTTDGGSGGGATPPPPLVNREEPCGGEIVDDQRHLAGTDENAVEIEEMGSVLLEFSLEEDSLVKFAGYAENFAHSLEKDLLESRQFRNVRVMLLGAGANEKGIWVIAALNYVLNRTSQTLNDIDTAINIILGIINSNRDQLETSFSFKDVRYAEVDQLNLSNKDSSSTPSARVIVGAVTGSLALIGLAAVVVGVVIRRRKGNRRNYETVPLITEEGQWRRWFRLPWGKKEVIIEDQKF